MAFTWPPRTTYAVKERISQVLWVLKDEGDIEDKQCAVRVLKERLAAHGVEITAEHGFRLMLSEMEGGKYGDLILRKVNGRRTQGLYLVTEDMPPNFLPDANLELDESNLKIENSEGSGETFTRQSLFGEPAVKAPSPAAEIPAAAVPEPKPEPVTVPTPAPAVAVAPAPKPAPAPEPVVTPAPVMPAAVSAPTAAVDAQFDLIAAGLEAELDELRKPMPTYPRVTVKERVGQDRNLGDKAGVLSAILELVGDLAVMVAGEPTVQEADVKTKERLADAIDRAERFRRRALDTEETAVALRAEINGLRRQVGDKDGKIARLEANVEALMNGEKAADDRLVNAAKRFISEKPNDRRGESKLVYSTGG